MILIVAAKELVRGFRLWAGSLVVIVVSSAVSAAAVAQFQTAATLSAGASRSLISTTQGIVAFTLLAAVVITGATTNLAVASGRRGYALLQLAGVLPRQIMLMVIVQLLMLAAVGTGLGIGLGRLIAQPLLDLTIAQTSAPAGTVVVYDGEAARWAFGLFAVLVVLGGVRAAIRAGLVRPVEALREPEPPRIRMGVFRWVGVGIAGMAALGVGLGLAGMSPSFAFRDQSVGMSLVIGLGMLFSILLTVTAATVAPVLYPLVLRMWTSLIPSRLSGAWFLARRSCRYRITQSTAAITPLMVGIALPGSMYTLFLTAGGAMSAGQVSSGINTSSIFTILGPALLLAAIGSAAVIFMTSSTRARDNALVSVSGGTFGTAVLSATLEALIYVITALLIAATVFGLVGLAVAAAFSHVTRGVEPVYGISTALLIAAGGAVIVSAATVLPTVTPTRRSIPSLIGSE